MHLIRKLFSSLHVVVLPLRFKIENDLATLSEVGQMFPYTEWIPVPSRQSPLFSRSWGVLQQLKPPLLLIFPVEWSEVQICGAVGFSMCTHSACKDLIPPAPFPVWLWGAGDCRRLLCWHAQLLLFHRTWHCPFQRGCYPRKHLQTFVQLWVQWGKGCLCGISSHPWKCWARKIEELLRKPGNKSWTFGIRFRLS